MIVDKFLYQKISFALMNVMVLVGVSGLMFLSLDSSIFIEWSFGGGSINFSLTLLMDWVSCSFLTVVLCISSNVVWYSKSYMGGDGDANRFILLVLGFVVSMVILIISPNIFSILLGWDGLGLISYCLVIYYPSKKSNSAGMITVLSNRVGDVCVLLSIAWFVVLGDFNFSTWSLGGDLTSLMILSFLVMVAALTKSAQIPFSAWLPAAMAAPTPVSALVHSSTLVTAGVYLLIRFSFLLGELGSSVLMFISMMTMFMSGVVAIFECDLKKIIALSTLSQLGMMMFAISLGLYQVAFFHLLSHALFKALLFLCAGVLIHGVGSTQDVRYFGGLVKNFPLVSVCMNLANFSLCGIPFMSGFYSKDLIVELACQDSWGMGILFLMFVCLGLTVLYSVRLSFLAFISTPGYGSFCSVCEQDFTLLGPVATLTFISLLSGPSLSLLSFSYPVLIFLPWVMKMGALVVISASVVLSVSVLGITSMGLSSSTFLSTFSGFMWFMPWLSGQGVLMSSMKKADSILKILDQGWLEFYLGKVTESSPSKFNTISLGFQRNALKLHFSIFLVWLLMILIYLI
uniref:NADH-ubiquinone oxidoreductase chain 5 n=1 Tax=Daphnia galeata TaxID=27404 RepID=A0A1S7J0G0_9CRUS|nr:NADH dehydrogenase subunit 5 [Daphnia galeata]